MANSDETYTLPYNPDDVPNKEFKEIPPGDYILEVTKFEFMLAKESKRPMFKVEFHIAAGEFEGVPIFENLTLPMDASVEERDKHAWKLTRFMRALTDNEKWTAKTVSAKDVLGGRLVATLHHEEYEGVKYARIRNAIYKPLSAWKGVITPSAKDVAKAAKNQAASPATPPPVGDDDEVA